MPRTYTRVLGPSGYQKYEDSDLQRAIRDVRNGKFTLCEAAERFSIPKSTLSRKVRGLNPLNIGGQTALTQEDEKFITEGIVVCAEWGFPLTTMDIRLLVKTFLDSRGKVERRFDDNVPGKDWARAFIGRQPNLTQRLSQNIKRHRAGVSREIIQKYFDNLQTTLRGVPVSNIVNYDETNMTDDPGNQKVIVRRGTKHPERVMDFSKTSTSVMFAAAADGTILPPYTVYRATHLYPGWVEGGVEGAAYNRNKSGWFDQAIFADWFRTIILPYFRRLEGPKVLLGDNAPTHLDVDVVNLCVENNIRFVLLPPNATQLVQPLDVSTFGPLKREWRKVLGDWKKQNRGVLPKNEFPRMLKAALESCGSRLPANVVAGFKACGIFPFDPQAVLKRLPRRPQDEDEGSDHERSWTDAFVQHLSAARHPTGEQSRPARQKKIAVSPGKSVTAAAIRPQRLESSSEEEEQVDDVQDVETDQENEDDEEKGGESDEGPPDNPADDVQVGNFILVKLISEAGSPKFYLAKVLASLPKERFRVSYLRRKKGVKATFYIYPNVLDEGNIEASQVVQIVECQDLRRGRYKCDSIEDVRVE